MFEIDAEADVDDVTAANDVDVYFFSPKIVFGCSLLVE